MSERFANAWGLLPGYLSQHVVLSAAAMVLGLLVSLALVVAAVRSERVRWPVLAFASLIQTVPSLALLALFYPLLLAASELAEKIFGTGFSALGFLPSLLALALYSMLPVVRNGVAGILNIDTALVEAARGVGMTEWQRLWRVELPLATHVGLKTTRLRSLSGEQVVFSNTDLLNSRIRNYGRMFERRVVSSIGVTYQTPAAKLRRIPELIREIVERQANVRFDRAHFQAFGESALTFEIVYYVLTPDYNYYMDVQQSINFALLEQLAAEGVEFAYPTQTVLVSGVSR